MAPQKDAMKAFIPFIKPFWRTSENYKNKVTLVSYRQIFVIVVVEKIVSRKNFNHKKLYWNYSFLSLKNSFLKDLFPCDNTIVWNPYTFLLGSWASYQIIKKGDLTEFQFFQGSCWEGWGDFFLGVAVFT